MTEFITKEEAASLMLELHSTRFPVQGEVQMSYDDFRAAINLAIAQKFDFIGTTKLWNKGGSGEFISVEWEDKPEHDTPLYALKGDSK
jgi:hypothetical protein